MEDEATDGVDRHCPLLRMTFWMDQADNDMDSKILHYSIIGVALKFQIFSHSFSFSDVYQSVTSTHIYTIRRHYHHITD